MFVHTLYTESYMCVLQQNKEDSCAWLGHVLGDMCLFVLLLNDSHVWMPRSMTSQEFVKYALAQTSTINNNDDELQAAEVQQVEDIGDELDDNLHALCTKSYMCVFVAE